MGEVCWGGERGVGKGCGWRRGKCEEICGKVCWG